QLHADELRQTIGALGVARQRQAELTGYAALITRAQEEERRRIARDLHDDTAQALVAICRGLETLSTHHSSAMLNLPVSSRDQDFIDSLSELAKRSLDSIRRSCQDLRPSVLDDLGLSAALESLANAMTARGLRCSYSQLGEVYPCPPEIEVALYRIAQESLSNAQRHADATEITIKLSYSLDCLRLAICDDGCGFNCSEMLHRVSMATDLVHPGNMSAIRGDAQNASAVRTADGRCRFGLLGLRERAALIGAQFDLMSTPGKGTTIMLCVPLLPSTPPQATAIQERLQSVHEAR